MFLYFYLLCAWIYIYIFLKTFYIPFWLRVLMFCYNLIFRHDLLVSVFWRWFFKKSTVVLMNDYWYVYTFSLLHNDGGYNKLSGQSSNLVDSCIQGWNPIPTYESAIVHSTGLNQNLPTLMKTTKKFGLLFIYVHIHRYTLQLPWPFKPIFFFLWESMASLPYISISSGRFGCVF